MEICKSAPHHLVMTPHTCIIVIIDIDTANYQLDNNYTNNKKGISVN